MTLSVLEKAFRLWVYPRYIYTKMSIAQAHNWRVNDNNYFGNNSRIKILLFFYTKMCVLSSSHSHKYQIKLFICFQSVYNPWACIRYSILYYIINNNRNYFNFEMECYILINKPRIYLKHCRTNSSFRSLRMTVNECLRMESKMHASDTTIHKSALK
jgi:hypothetical protein